MITSSQKTQYSLVLSHLIIYVVVSIDRENSKICRCKIHLRIEVFQRDPSRSLVLGRPGYLPNNFELATL